MTTDSGSHGSFKLLLLVLMVLQNSFTVLVGRYTRAGVPEDQLYVVNHLIVVTEMGKFVLSCGLEYHGTQGKLLESFQRHVVDRPMDALKILIPALLYLVQNSLLYVALSNLTAPIFQVTYQAKLVTTAIVSVIMLQRKYTPQQWVCLVGLSLGVAIVVLGESGKKNEEHDASKANSQNLALGLTAVSIACFSSALAGVYFEKVVKKKTSTEEAKNAPQASLWMRNMQLAFYSVVIALFQGAYAYHKNPTMAEQTYFHGFSFWVWVLVLLQAGGGLLVAAVIKYADNVLKGLATGVSVVFATTLSIFLFGTPISGQFFVGGSMILSSVYVFSNPIKTKDVTKGKDTEMVLPLMRTNSQP